MRSTFRRHVKNVQRTSTSSNEVYAIWDEYYKVLFYFSDVTKSPKESHSKLR